MSVATSLITFLIVFAVVALSSIQVIDDYPVSQVEGILVEAHGLLFDLLVFGVLFLLFTSRQEKRRSERANCELIDDYRSWISEEATHRIVGAIRRLSGDSSKLIDASACFLRNASLDNRDLGNAIFRNSNLRGASFRGADLSKANFFGADCREASFHDTNLSGCVFANADLRGAHGLSVERIRTVRTIAGARLNPDVESKLRGEVPDVFEGEVTSEESGLPVVSLRMIGIDDPEGGVEK